MKFKIYFERPANSNPYYTDNKELNHLSKIIDDLSTNIALKDKYVYTGIIGGQRNQSPYECEINLELIKKDGESVNGTIDLLKKITRKYDGKYMIDEVKQC
ncbi:MAG: hypothetical protein Q8S24_04530 [Eubacteriales bacterium]|nr:hypothetical protein [Eubacteriales bacterium]